MVRAIMHGCNGKMGQVITNLVKEDEEIEIVAGIDTYTGLKNAYPVYADISEWKWRRMLSLIFPTRWQWMDCLNIVRRNRSRSYFVQRDFQRSSLHGLSIFREGCGVKIRKYVTGDQSVVKTSAGCGKDPCSGKLTLNW